MIALLCFMLGHCDRFYVGPWVWERHDTGLSLGTNCDVYCLRCWRYRRIGGVFIGPVEYWPTAKGTT